MNPAVSVIIPAYNAGATIARAVASALAEPQVAEVIVVDDASTDDTMARARHGDDGSRRLIVDGGQPNGGPARARNRAIARATAPLIAVLDADDFFVPGRLAMIEGDQDWDFLADNIAFVDPADVAQLQPERLASAPDRRRDLSFREFVDRNISRRGHSRSELGFVKAVMRREVLLRLGLRYEEALRLGEDFVLYGTALSKGARFRLSMRCGYVAVQRPDSLSGKHSTKDLAAFTAAVGKLADEMQANGADPVDLTVLAQMLRGLSARTKHRRFLDTKRRSGLIRAVMERGTDPIGMRDVAWGLLQDRWGSAPQASSTPRLLFLPKEFGGQ